MRDERRKKIETVLNHRQSNLAIVLEDVEDPRNITAVMRTSDAVGVQDVYLINTGKQLPKRFGFKSGRSAEKWVSLHHFSTVKECFEVLRKKFSVVLTTHLSSGATDLYSIDFTKSVALVFGNEVNGVSEEARMLADGNFTIPQIGMLPSLNISVACAVSIYEAYRQKRQAGHYEQSTMPTEQMEQLRKEWGIED